MFKDELEAKQKELNSMRKISELFPDIKEHRNRWGTIRLTTKDANSKTNQAQICHSCGCCEDAPLQAWPYLEVDGIKVFSDPPYFTVGEKIPYYYGMGERPYDEWEQKLRDANIPESIISIVQDYFNENKPKHVEYVDDDDNDNDF